MTKIFRCGGGTYRRNKWLAVAVALVMLVLGSASLTGCSKPFSCLDVLSTEAPADADGSAEAEQEGAQELPSQEEMAAVIDGMVEEWYSSHIHFYTPQLQRLWRIFTYVHETMTYVEAPDTSELEGAYIAFTTHKSDCFGYFTMSKCLLARCGFETLDVEREGGIAKHFWLLVNYYGQWYHFDPICQRADYDDPYWYCFLRTDEEVADFTVRLGHDREFYTYDHTGYPEVAKTPLNIKYGR